MRNHLPLSIKRFLRLQQRRAQDRRAGLNRRFATTKRPDGLPESIVAEIKQPIFDNPLSANKVENIRTAIGHIQAIVIHAGEIFSFWETVGPPDSRRGFKTGRAIIGGRLESEIGGGLCQVSGMIYHLALASGMTIIERHSHTLDLYRDGERYTPLGADAAVAHGYKDLRFENSLPDPVFLTFRVDQASFVGQLKSTSAFPRYEIVFDREEHPTYRTVRTCRTLDADAPQCMGLSTYLFPESDPRS